MSRLPDAMDPSEIRCVRQMRKALEAKGLTPGKLRGTQTKLDAMFREGATSWLGRGLVLDLSRAGVSEQDLLDIAMPLPDASLSLLIHWALEKDLNVLAKGLFGMLDEDRRTQVMTWAIEHGKNTFFESLARNIPAQRTQILLSTALDHDNIQAGVWLLANTSGKTPMEFAERLRSSEQVGKLDAWWAQVLADGAITPPKASRALTRWRLKMPLLDAYLKSQKLMSLAERQVVHNEVTSARPKPRL